MMWTDTVDMLDMAFKGMIIGVASSAPMGPSGVLAVQRTLNKGRWYGFFTGLGVALSDVVYATVAGLGLGFVVDIISNPRVSYWLQLLGSVLLFGFGWYVYRSNPSRNIHPSSNRKGSLMHNAVTGFLITFSNPLIVFLYLALFARFNFVTPEHPVDRTVGYIFLFIGAMTWWYGLSYGISKVGDKFRESGLLWLNRTIGIVVMVVSVLGFYYTLRGRALY